MSPAVKLTAAASIWEHEFTKGDELGHNCISNQSAKQRSYTISTQWSDCKESDKMFWSKKETNRISGTTFTTFYTWQALCKDLKFNFVVKATEVEFITRFQIK